MAVFGDREILLQEFKEKNCAEEYVNEFRDAISFSDEVVFLNPIISTDYQFAIGTCPIYLVIAVLFPLISRAHILSLSQAKKWNAVMMAPSAEWSISPKAQFASSLLLTV